MSKTKRKQQMRRDQRPVPRRSWVERVPVLPVVVAAVLIIGAVYVAYAGATSGLFSAKSTASASVNGIPCDTTEHADATAKHIHAHLDIYFKGAAVNLPANLGISQANQCLYWLHTHDATGVMHIEAPAKAKDRVFTLGDAFDVWALKLDRHNVATLQIPADGSLVAFVNGKPYTGDPRKIPLNAHDEIVLEITPGAPAEVPSSYSFPAGEKGSAQAVSAPSGSARAHPRNRPRPGSRRRRVRGQCGISADGRRPRS